MTLRAVSISFFVVSLLALVGAGCSSVEAKVGAAQAACGLDSKSGTPATQGGGYYPVGAAKTPASPTCEANTGSACDDCEGTHCCATRSACYGDPVCACADLAFDHCLDDAETAPAAEIAAQRSQCLAAFSAAGTAEKARIACQRAWCQTECEVP